MRDRTENIAVLARAFLVKCAGAQQMRSPSTEALEVFKSYQWPGNIRELENAIYRSVVMARRR